MAEIKGTAETAAKWKRRTENAGQEYAAGVSAPRRDWATETAKAEDNYNKGVQAAITAKRFGKGVRKAGTAKWQENALKVGPQRFAEGVANAADAYAAGFDPYRQVISNLTLPERGPKGSQQNLLRVAAVANALHEKKVSGA